MAAAVGGAVGGGTAVGLNMRGGGAATGGTISSVLMSVGGLSDSPGEAAGVASPFRRSLSSHADVNGEGS